jgi:hypothetical protein
MDRTAMRLPAPVGLLLFLLTEVLLVDVGSLSAAVVLAATAAAGSALAVCAVISRHVPAVPHHRVRTALRDRACRTAFLPQRDPDAPGRKRPRAPGRRLPTTA